MIDRNKQREMAGLPAKEYVGNHFGMVGKEPLPFSDVKPISPKELMGESMGEPSEEFDPTSETAPSYWPENMAALWPNLAPEERTMINNALDGAGTEEGL